MHTCSLNIDGLCGLPATRVIVVQSHGGTGTAHFRCAVHDPAPMLPVIARVDPDAVAVILPLQLPAVV
jgi:hypothetical protein